VETFGDPKEVNRSLIERVKKIRIKKVVDEDYLRLIVVQSVDSTFSVLDCGQSLRNYSNRVKEKSALVETLDINEFGEYPDFLVDVCDERGMSTFANKYDLITAFSLIEHCHDPFKASSNLFAALKKGGQIVGSAPFLFPRHGPADLSYQDFWRFSRDSYAILFPDASDITLYPLRGRIGTALNVLTLRYRFSFETRFHKLSSRINRWHSRNGHELQASGYGFIVTK